MSDKFFLILTTCLAVVCTGFAGVAANPNWRQTVRDWVLSSNRKVLAKAEGPLGSHAEIFTVIKVQTPESLSLEVYSKAADSEHLQFQKRVVLPEKRDGFFNYRGNALNLVLSDIDDDGALEILAPTFDENLIPRLHVYKFDPATQIFTLMPPDSIHL